MSVTRVVTRVVARGRASRSAKSSSTIGTCSERVAPDDSAGTGPPRSRSVRVRRSTTVTTPSSSSSRATSDALLRWGESLRNSRRHSTTRPSRVAYPPRSRKFRQPSNVIVRSTAPAVSMGAHYRARREHVPVLVYDPAVPGPLEGVRVVELGVWVAGPGAGGILADWGADVIKVEPPEGDPARTFQRMLGGDLPTNPPFELDNRSKRSVVLDLADPIGRAHAQDLIDRADVFLTNIRVSALQRLELDPDVLLARHERLIYALITGYGLAGPDAARPAYDIA